MRFTSECDLACNLPESATCCAIYLRVRLGLDGGHDVQRDIEPLEVSVDQLCLELHAQQREIVAVLHVRNLVLLLKDTVLQLLGLYRLYRTRTVKNVIRYGAPAARLVLSVSNTNSDQ